MQRRSFIKNISLATAITPLMPFLTFGKMNFPADPIFRFIIASDGHYGQSGTDFESVHQTLIDSINKEEKVGMVIFNGDLIHDEPKWMPEVKKVYERLQAPYFPVRGNHDRITVQAWEEIWGISPNFAFVQEEKFGFILADSSNEKGEYLCVDFDFLKNKLNEFEQLSHVFVCIHISQQDWTRHGVSCKEVMDLLASYPNVKAVIHGHDHDVNGVMLYKKKPFVWTGHFGGNWGSPVPGYRVVEIGADGSTVTYLKSMKDDRILSGYTL